MPYFIDCAIPATSTEAIQIQIPPQATAAQVLKTLRELDVSTDSSVVPEALQESAKAFPPHLSADIASILATTFCRPVSIFLKPRHGDCAPSECIPLCSLHTEGLWPSVSKSGKLQFLDQSRIGFAQDQAKNGLRFVQRLLDLANEKAPLPSPDELPNAAVDQIRRMTASGLASFKLDLEQFRQNPPNN